MCIFVSAGRNVQYICRLGVLPHFE